MRWSMRIVPARTRSGSTMPSSRRSPGYCRPDLTSDLDIVVRVPAEDFAAADASLAARFQRNEGSIRTETFSAFEDASCRPHLGIQLVVIDGPLDFFHLFVDALMGSPRLVHAYNALKKRHEGRDMAEYREAKDRFVEQVLADARSSAHPL